LKRVTITYIEYKNVIRLDRFGPPRIPCGEGGISKGDRFICGSVFYPATPGRNWQLSMEEVRSFLNFLENSVVHEGECRYLGIRKRSSERIAVLRCCSWLASGPSFLNRSLPGFPGANIKEFWLTILSEAKRPQIHVSEPEGRVLDLQWSEL
jgi:hypothetical protein